MDPTIFLCHAREDKDRVQAIYLQLRAAGLNPWMDKPPPPFTLEGILPGAEWDVRIRKEIRQCAYFLAFLSPRSVSKRGYVQREFRLALSMASETPMGQIFLIPVMLDPCEPPEFLVDTLSLAQLHWIELDSGNAEPVISVLEHDIKRRPSTVTETHLRLMVTTAEEFLAALGPNRLIQLAPGTYSLSDLEARYMQNAEFDKVFDGEQLVVQDLQDLTIRGAPGGSTRIVVNPQYAYVLRFVRCTGLKISDVVFGHEPESGFCSGGVLAFSSCSNVMLHRCELFGCGTEGLTLYDLEEFAFTESTIRDCKSGIMSVRKSRDLMFRKSNFIRNEQYYGVAVSHSRSIAFEECIFEGNHLREPLFSIHSSQPIVVQGGRIQGNTLSRLLDRPERVTLQDVMCANNILHEAADGDKPIFWHDERGENDLE